MKNVTIFLDEEVARWVRLWAAENDTSVSRCVGELLKTRMASHQRYEQAMKRFLVRRPQTLKTSGQYPGREEVHEILTDQG